MTSGRLRERVTFQRLTEGDDGFGNTVTGWENIEKSPGVPLTVWADIRETLGKERVDAGRVEDSNTATIRIRASIATRAITAANRVIMRGEAWNIRSVVPVANVGAMLDLLCERNVAT